MDYVNSSDGNVSLNTQKKATENDKQIKGTLKWH